MVDPFGQHTVPTGSDYYYFHTFLYIPMFPLFQNITNENKCCVKIIIATGQTMGLAKSIIDDTCLILSFILY